MTCDRTLPELVITCPPVVSCGTTVTMPLIVDAARASASARVTVCEEPWAPAAPPGPCAAPGSTNTRLVPSPRI